MSCVFRSIPRPLVNASRCALVFLGQSMVEIEDASFFALGSYGIPRFSHNCSQLGRWTQLDGTERQRDKSKLLLHARPVKLVWSLRLHVTVQVITYICLRVLRQKPCMPACLSPDATNRITNDQSATQPANMSIAPCWSISYS